jgi:hypothetical protein
LLIIQITISVKYQILLFIHNNKNMKYYRLSYNSLNEKITGTQFQCITGSVGDMQNDNLPFEGKIENDFELPIPILEDKANLTPYLNVMFISSWFLVLENNFITFLKQFNFDEIQTWSIIIKQKNKINDNYSLFYIPKAYQSEVINFKESVFYSCDFFNHIDNIKKEEINDYENYLKIREKVDNENRILKYNTLVLNLNNFDKDFFRLINCPFGGNFVSERLKNEIQKNGFESMMFEEIESIDNKVKVIY